MEALEPTEQSSLSGGQVTSEAPNQKKTLSADLTAPETGELVGKESPDMEHKETEDTGVLTVSKSLTLHAVVRMQAIYRGKKVREAKKKEPFIEYVQWRFCILCTTLYCLDP